MASPSTCFQLPAHAHPGCVDGALIKQRELLLQFMLVNILVMLLSMKRNASYALLILSLEDMEPLHTCV